MTLRHFIFGLLFVVLGFVQTLALADPTQSAPDDAANPATESIPAPESAAEPLPRARRNSTTQLPARFTALPSGANVAIIRVDGTIYDYTYESFKRRCEKAIADGATIIVVELDTPGGLIDASLRLSTYIKSLPNVTTIAWVNPQAYSGGTVLAAACHFIIMSPASYLGDAAPISMLRSLDATERAKLLSPLLEDFRDSAQYHNYDYSLFHAMCVLGVEAYLVENPATGERRVVNAVDYAWMVHGGLQGDSNNVTSTTGNVNLQTPPDADPIDGAKPDITAVYRVSASDADVGQWRPVTQTRAGQPMIQPFHDGTTLLTLNQDRAMEVGLAQAIVRNDTELKNLLAAGKVVRYDQAMLEGLAYWLTQSWVRGLLFLIVLTGAFLELQSPGIGIAGTVAVIALAILVGAPLLIGIAGIWHVILILVGVVLLLVEFFILPGFGVAGVAGLVCLFAGLVLSAVPVSGGGFGLPGPEMRSEFTWSLIFMFAGLVGGIVALFFISRHFKQLPFLGRMILTSPPSGPVLATAGASAGAADQPTPPRQALSGDDAIGRGTIYPGALGIAVTELRPTGRANIQGQLVDVLTVGNWIQPGTRLRVVEVHGNLISVDVAAR